ncbi:hypothetical protein ACTD5D_41260 [Nocardia takedensis]|uniref:hypothetical protein n=1 Tax=Nocardia takedensis TaxID=259390 RepID=UPI003F7681F4
MIEFNVTPKRLPQGQLKDESLRDRTSRWWSCSEEKLAQFGDIAFAVEANLVTAVFRITGWKRDPESGKVALALDELPVNHPAMAWVGLTAPVPWEPGQRQPFKYVSRNGLLPAAPMNTHGRRAMSQIAEAAARYITDELAEVHPAPKVVATYEVIRVVFGLLRSGSPFPGGPRVMEQFDELTPAITGLEVDLSKFATRVATGRPFGSPEAADQYAETAAQLLRHVSRRFAQPRAR